MIYTSCLDLYPISLQELIAISGKTFSPKVSMVEINQQTSKDANCKQFFHNKILTLNLEVYIGCLLGTAKKYMPWK